MDYIARDTHTIVTVSQAFLNQPAAGISLGISFA
jgi:hypothetical protein